MGIPAESICIWEIPAESICTWEPPLRVYVYGMWNVTCLLNIDSPFGADNSYIWAIMLKCDIAVYHCISECHRLSLVHVALTRVHIL